MTSDLARQEMARFLSTSRPEVLSVAGRWGVGKTYAWSRVLSETRKAHQLPLDRYAYVSAFGVRTLDDLKTSIFQATVRADRESVVPTLESFRENLASLEGLSALAETGSRRAAKIIRDIVGLIPGLGKAADYLVPAAGLLIRNQIICIDDLERSGEGLPIADILGFVSMLREERQCKVVLLLNEEGLGEHKASFRKYLEKVVDQAISFAPDPRESADVALDPKDQKAVFLGNRTTELGITNIRVIKRIERFLSHLDPVLDGLNPSVFEQAASSLAILGWCVFEPDLAPNLDFVKRRASWNSILRKEDPTAEEASWNALLDRYHFSHLDDFDKALLDGLLAGGFEVEAVRGEAKKASALYDDAASQQGIRAPWQLYGGSFEDNENQLVDALIHSVEAFGKAMSPGDLDNVISTLRELRGEEGLADLIQLYMNQQEDRPREFFDLETQSLRREIDPLIRSAFSQHLAALPIDRDPVAILLGIEEKSSWNSRDVNFLASLTEDQFYEILKASKGDDLSAIVKCTLRFAKMSGTGDAEKEIGRKAILALRKIGAESNLNALRVRPYLPNEDHEALLDKAP